MKKFRDLTDEQCIEIGKLALQHVISFDFVSSAYNGQDPRTIQYKLNVEREIFDEDGNLMVIRVRIDGMPDCYASLWEPEFDVDVVEDSDDSTTSNQALIICKLMQWGFIPAPPNQEFLDLIMRMRNAQKNYFAFKQGTREKQEYLHESKVLESAVDKMIQSFKNNQQKLF